MPSTNYDPFDWYWIVGNDESRVYSSASGDYVTPADASYIRWLGDGKAPTRISSETELGEVLAQYSIRPSASAVLDSYKGRQAREINVQALAKVLYQVNNRLLALEGKAALSAAEFRTFVKGLM